jgi:hypothetical protein
MEITPCAARQRRDMGEKLVGNGFAARELAPAKDAEVGRDLSWGVSRTGQLMSFWLLQLGTTWHRRSGKLPAAAPAAI